MAAFRAMVHHQCPQREQVIADFYNQWQQDPLVIDKWFIIQATAAVENSLEDIKALRQHNDFDIKNPNRVRSLVAAFSQLNAVVFHDRSGEGYRLLADTVIELNAMNPQIAARLVLPLGRWRRFDEQRQALMKAELQRISELPDQQCGD